MIPRYVTKLGSIVSVKATYTNIHAGIVNAFGSRVYTNVHNLASSHEIKGSVQRKLRWVKNGVNRSVGASDCGAGHYFVVLFRFHLVFAIFPFPVSTAEFIGEFWKN